MAAGPLTSSFSVERDFKREKASISRFLLVFLFTSPNFVEIINYLFSIFSTIHEASFDSLPPGEKYHIPPNETHSSHNSQDIAHVKDILQEEVEHQEDEDPFDTSGIILPETSNVTMPRYDFT